MGTVRNTPSVDEAVQIYLDLRRARFAKDTWINDRSQLMRFASAMNGLQVGSLSAERVERFFLGEGGLSTQMGPAAFNKVLSRVGSFFSFCNRRGWLKDDLLAEIGRLKVTRRERLRLSAAEMLELPSYVDHPRDKALVALACNTALRASELTDLRLADVDLDGGWLRVRITKSHLEDLMPITVELDECLRSWLKVYAEQAGGPLRPTRTCSRRKAPAGG